MLVNIISKTSATGTNVKVGGGAQFFVVPPLFWLYKYNYTFWWALSWW